MEETEARLGQVACEHRRELWKVTEVVHPSIQHFWN